MPFASANSDAVFLLILFKLETIFYAISNFPLLNRLYLIEFSLLSFSIYFLQSLTRHKAENCLQFPAFLNCHSVTEKDRHDGDQMISVTFS